MEKGIKRTITISDVSYQFIKEYCNKNNLKIGGVSEKILISYIQENEIDLLIKKTLK